MRKKILFSFGGTGEDVTTLCNYKEKDVNFFSDDVIRVYLSGCQANTIGGKSLGLGYIDPNLDVVAATLRDCFNAETGEISWIKLQQTFGSSIVIKGLGNEESTPVSEISLSGYSRGGVTTFAVSRHLDDLNIPMSIFATEPVPGDSKQNAKQMGSEFFKNYDLSLVKNIKHAEVALGAYRNATSGILRKVQNKFFRQMVPIFSSSCDASIYVIPKSNHYKLSYRAYNHYYDFLYHQGLIKSKLAYSIQDTLFFVPKIAQQKFHIGGGRIELSSLYKFDLCQKILDLGHDTENTKNIKKSQALYAIEMAPFFDVKNSLIEKIMLLDSAQGKSLREFIVEFENINQFVFRKQTTDHENTSMAQFRVEAYQKLHQFFEQKSPNPQQQQAFRLGITHALENIRADISKEHYFDLKRLIEMFLQENIIFHPDLSKYIDEMSSDNEKISPSLNGLTQLNHVTDAEELAALLYGMSNKERGNAYDKFCLNLPALVQHDVTKLANIIRFLPPDKISLALQIPEIRQDIKKIDDLQIIMKKLFSENQKKIIFNVFKDTIKNMAPSPKDLELFMQHLTLPQCKVLKLSLESKSNIVLQNTIRSRLKRIITFNSSEEKTLFDRGPDKKN